MIVLPMTIEHQEWDAVASLARRLQLADSVDVPVVALRSTGGRRQWSVHAPWVYVEIPGPDTGTGPDTATTWLPTRLIIHAAELAATEGYCTLEIEPDSLTVSNACGSAEFDVPKSAPALMRRPIRRFDDVAGADTSVGQLAHLLRSARRLPDGVDPPPAGSATPPDLWLAVEPRHIAATVAWSHFGSPRVTVRTPAWTTGTAVARVPHVEMLTLLGAFDDDADLHVELDEEQFVLRLDGSGWSAVVALSQLPVAPAADAAPVGAPATVPDALAGFAIAAVAEGRWSIAVRGVTVLVEDLVHGNVVRATIRLASDVEPSPAVLAELNSINAGLTRTRVWVADGELLAGVHQPTRYLGELTDAVNTLIVDTTDIGAVIGMLGATRDAASESASVDRDPH